MANSGNLFQLVHSLSQSEKRYFRLYAFSGQQGNATGYLQLFSFIDKNPGCDDAAIRRKFAGAAFVKQLSVAKNYLFRLLLESLRNYHQGKTAGLNLTARLDHIELLFARELFSICLQQADLALKSADELDLPLKCLEFLRWKMRLHRTLPGKDMQDILDKLYQREKQLLAQIDMESEMLRLYDRIFPLVLQQQALSGPDSRVETVLREIAAHPFIQDEPEDMAFDAKVMRAYVLIFASHFRGESLERHALYYRMVVLWRANPARVRLERQRFAKTLLGYLDACFEVDDFADVPAIFEDLGEVLGKDKALTRGNAVRVYNMRIRYLLRIGNYQEAESLIPLVAEAIKAGQALVEGPLELSVRCNVANVMFIRERFSECIKWLHQITQMPRDKVRTDIKSLARTLSMISHFELGNGDILEHLVGELRSYLKREKRGGAFEMAVANGLVRLSATPARLQELKILDELEAELQEKGPGVLEREVFAWIKARRQNTSIEHALKDFGGAS